MRGASAVARPRPPLSRLEWDGLLAMARRLSRGLGLSSEFDLMALRHDISRCEPERFPVQQASAVLMAKGFAHIARAFVVAGLPEDRELMGASLNETAACLEQLLDQQRRTEAEFGRRVLGERED